MNSHPDAPQGPPAAEITRLADRLFRHESGKLVSVLTRIFGIDRLQLAEDVVQEALVRAMQTWPYYGVPDNPAAWITQTAKHLALDVLRREKRFQDKQPTITVFVEQGLAQSAEIEPVFLEGEIKDDRLRMMFACCHPAIPREARVSLALKTLCGFSVAEIAKAFLTSEAAIAKRLTRARQRIRESHVPFEIPSGDELTNRIEGVEQTLYLLFNEGYKASSGDSILREELCHEAIGLATMLVEHPAGNRPSTHALLALMLLNAARLPARVGPGGEVLRLDEQDRSSWSQPMIARGMMHLGESAAGNAITPYHVQAGISACHCAARDFASTDWKQILALYDRLVEMDDSPVVALNRAVAVGKAEGPEAAIAAVNAIRNREPLNAYYLLYAVQGEFEAEMKHYGAAAEHFRRAIELTDVTSEQALLTNRLRDCEELAAVEPDGGSNSAR